MDIRKGKPLNNPFHYGAQILKVALLGAIVLSILFALNQIKFANYFPIKTVRVYGMNRTDRQEIQELLTPLVNRGFFTVNIEYIHDRLQQMPWISKLSVRRIWPDQIEVTVVEKNAVARWNQTSLLSEGGEIFSPKQETYPLNLPLLVGPDGQQMVMLEYLTQINKLLAPLHSKVSYLELTPFFTWKLTLNNGITLQVGHKDILTRLDHFVKVYPKIVGNRASDVEYIDLRYPNGMAVRWRAIFKT